MSGEGIAAAYAGALTDTVTVQRLTGSAPNNALFSAENVRARVMGYALNEIQGTISQGDQKVILLKADLDAKNWPPGGGPPVAGDRIVTSDGRTLGIRAVDSSTRRVGSEIIAYECQARGQ